MEGVFIRSHCDKEDQVMFATGQLLRGAKDWWDTYSKEIGEDKVQTLTWDREIELKRQAEREEKRQVEKGSTQGSSKKPKTHDQGKKDDSKGGFPRCKTCGKPHSGECLLGKKGCYNRGQEGHPYYNCPNPKRVCYNYNESGHVKAECPKLKQGVKKEGRYG
ncbi:uncharacterized protein LOC110866905 [Helianthus annuus]|uniref:uncharacterized protein LOC110866905 n=1 Tax=Helianthus annuus TaxID=4232 RepID=UPI000B909F1A|nr:uncharacterized protein LOC110866905 [Helianthus annuus]